MLVQYRTPSSMVSQRRLGLPRAPYSDFFLVALVVEPSFSGNHGEGGSESETEHNTSPRMLHPPLGLLSLNNFWSGVTIVVQNGPEPSLDWARIPPLVKS
jgi:hypothetical protein